jgi:hypothetical protein
MTATRKWIYVIVGLMVFLVLLNFGVQNWVKSKLPEIFQNNTDYELQFNQADVSIFRSSLALENVAIRPKNRTEKPSDSLVVNIHELKVSGVNLFKLLFKDDIAISHVKIIQPEIHYSKFSEKQKDSISSKPENQKSIAIKSFEIEGGKLYFSDSKDKEPRILEVNNVNIFLDNINYNQETSLRKIPFTYENVTVKIDSLDYHPNNVYHLQTQQITFENNTFNIEEFRLTPKLSRSGFLQQLVVEKDLYNFSVQSISLSDIDWGFLEDDFYIKSPSLELSKLNADIFRSKVPEDDTSKKLLYSALLRELPFFMEVDKVMLKDSQIAYEEEVIRGQPGKLTFSQFNATISNVNSGYKKTELPDVAIDVDCIFMHESKLKVNWTFNPMNKNEEFKIKGNLFKYDLHKTTPFIKPRIFASAEGTAHEIAFNFSGNDVVGSGNFLINYDDLKITAYTKDLSQKNLLKEAIANILVKKSSNGEQKEVEIKPVYRKQDRSFFNFFWSCVEQGLIQTIIII